MSKINILPEDLINKISAGEVVERPSSILKELVENSIDAEASEITVAITSSGIESITIEDNGIGMSSEEVLLALKRYTTSKIKDIHDLYTISTLGFRGEALPSIAAVSKMKIETKQKNSDLGTRIVLRGGEIIHSEPIGCKDGTSITVEDLFFNTPVRKKFLRGEETERKDCITKWNYCVCGFENISFTLHADSKHIHYPRTAKSKERILRIFGMNENDLIEFHHNSFDIELFGYVSHPHSTKSNSQSIYTYVNNRTIRNSSLNHAITHAYQDIIPHGKYPIAVLYITIPPHRIDVNVHPRKEEVKFSNQNEIYQLIYKSIKHALINKNYYSKPTQTAAQNFFQSSSQSFYAKTIPQKSPQEAIMHMNFIEEKKNVPVIDESIEKASSFADSTIIGQYNSTYIILEKDNNLILMDQHAAAERITYERLCTLEKNQDKKIQKLLFPVAIPIENLNKKIISCLIEELQTIGFNLAIQDEQLIFAAIPNLFLEAHVEKLFRDLYEELEENDIVTNAEEIKKNILKTLSCHHSLRANKNLNELQIRLLLADLDHARHNQTCPHGRPIYIKYTLGQFERMFGRA